MKPHPALALLRSTVPALLLIQGLAAAPALAQDFPNKAVRLVNPFAPGGSSSRAIQSISHKFQEVTGHALLVDNRPGAGSNVGSEFVARSTPDGYTILIGTSSLAINPNLYRKMNFDPLKDLAPVIVVMRTPNVLAVHPALPIRSVKEFVDYVRARPGQLNYASSGNGATNHMGMEMLKVMADLNIVHVPYKGGGEAMPALVGGQVQMMFSPAATLAPQHQAGRVRMIAVSGAKRAPDLDLPAVAENVPGFESDVWFGMFAPAGTPAPIIARINAIMNQILKDKDVAGVMQKGGLTPIGGTPEDMGRVLHSDHARWGQVVKATGIKID